MPSAILSRNRFETTVIVLLAVLVAATPVSSKAINLAWILVFAFACWVLLTRALERPEGKLLTHSESEPLTRVEPALYALVAFFLAGLMLQVGMRLYWAEPVRGVSFEITALASSGVAMVFARHWQAATLHRVALGVGLTVAAGLAVVQGYGYMFKGQPGPTNAVNWGAGIALFMCIALPLAVGRLAATGEKVLAVTGLVLFALGIFVAGRKGAFFAILWSVAVAGVAYARYAVHGRHRISRFVWVSALVIAVGLLSLHSKGMLSAPTDRVVNE